MSGDTARMLNREGWTCLLGVHEPGEYDRCEDCQDSCDELAEFLTPILRAAQAAALRDAADSVHDNAASPYCLPCHRDDADLLHTIADQIEKEN